MIKNFQKSCTCFSVFSVPIVNCLVILGNLSVFFILQHLTDFEEKYLKQVLLAQHFPTHLQSFTKYIETNASLRTILLSFVKKAIYNSRIGQNVNPPPPTKQC